MKRLALLLPLLIFACGAPTPNSSSLEISPLLTAAAVQMTAGAVDMTAALAPIASPTSAEDIGSPPVYKVTPQATDLPKWTGDPAGFIRWYFDYVPRVRNYAYTWSLLKPAFQKQLSPGGYVEYTQFWQTVNYVDIQDVRIGHRTSTAATINVTQRFYMRDSRILGPYYYTYHLVHDDARETWMFDYGP